jgi:hypothetical protein
VTPHHHLEKPQHIGNSKKFYGIDWSIAGLEKLEKPQLIMGNIWKISSPQCTI